MSTMDVRTYLLDAERGADVDVGRVDADFPTHGARTRFGAPG
jgi:hypothetical protein